MFVVGRNRNKIIKLKHHYKFLSVSSHNHPNIVKSDTKDIEIPDVTIHEFIYKKIENFSKYIGTECAETGRNYTFEQIRIKSRNLSKNLRQKFKLNDKDVIAFFLPNLPEYVICFLGSLEAKLIVTTMNHMYTADEIAKQIQDCSPSVVITQANYLNTLKSALNMTQRDLPVIIIKEKQNESIPRGTVDFFELINTVIDIPDIEPGKNTDVAIMPYSSGTTGLPKGVELIHRNSVANLNQLLDPDFSNCILPSDTFQDVSPLVLPFYHIYGMMLNFLSLITGVKAVALSKFIPESYIAALVKYPVTMIYAAPPLVLFLTAHPGVKKEYLETLRYISSGAAPLGWLDEDRFLKKVDHGNVRMVQGYGLTESSPVVSISPTYTIRSKKNAGSVGKVVPNTFVKIVNIDDPLGEPLGPNEKGEVLVKGPQVMKGYYNRPEETKNVLVDGWLRTGDIGYYNDEKHLYITDRLKELIKVKGFQVAPAELEEILRDHPSVKDAAVIGIPHELHGEVPRAYIVPKDDASFDVSEVNNYVTEKVASYKKLAGGIEIVNNIPKNPSGKILRRQLKEEYLNKN